MKRMALVTLFLVSVFAAGSLMYVVGFHDGREYHAALNSANKEPNYWLPVPDDSRPNGWRVSENSP